MKTAPAPVKPATYATYAIFSDASLLDVVVGGSWNSEQIPRIGERISIFVTGRSIIGVVSEVTYLLWENTKNTNVIINAIQV